LEGLETIAQVSLDSSVTFKFGNGFENLFLNSLLHDFELGSRDLLLLNQVNVAVNFTQPFVQCFLEFYWFVLALSFKLFNFLLKLCYFLF
jgi:hypothetical protein